MIETAPSNTDVSDISPEDDGACLAKLKSLVERSGTLLPAQGPLSGFAFLNPLQGLEDLPFEEGIMKGARLFGCRPYMSEDVYRDKLATGRIVLEDICAVLQSELADTATTPVTPSGTRFDMRLAMLQHPLRSAPPEELRWFIAETNALTRFSEETSTKTRTRLLEATRHWVMREVLSRADEPAGNERSANYRTGAQWVADSVERFGGTSMEGWDESTWEAFTLQLLWRVCREGVELVEIRPAPPSHFVRHRELLLEVMGDDSDLLVHPVLIRFCAAFSDQGISDWVLPDRERGFFRSFCTLYQSQAGRAERWMRPLSKELGRLDATGTTPLACIRESLEDLGVPEDRWGDFIEATVLALRGWAGMIWQMEVREDRVAKPAPQGSLIEFVAVRLLLERGVASMAVRAEVHDEYNRSVDAANARMAWGAASVNSWYKNASGRVTQNWPFSLLEFWQRTRHPDPEDYVLR